MTVPVYTSVDPSEYAFPIYESGGYYTQEKFDTTMAAHALWIDGLEGGVRADFSWEDLTQVVVPNGTNFTGACFYHTKLSELDLRNCLFLAAYCHLTNFERCDLAGAKLLGTYLVGAIMTEVNLYNTSICDTTGNGREIKAIMSGPYNCAYTSHAIQLGCQQLPIERWKGISRAVVARMDPGGGKSGNFYDEHHELYIDLVTTKHRATPSRYINTLEN